MLPSIRSQPKVINAVRNKAKHLLDVFSIKLLPISHETKVVTKI